MKLNNFIVLDIENPNTKANSICSISFIRVENNKIVEKVSSLINPEDNFDDINMRVNKITPNMVKNEITFDVFWNKYGNDIKSNIIVGHGIKYDLSVISKALKKYNIEVPEFKMICTQKLSQKYLDTTQYSLNKVCEYLNVELIEHHNSLCDTLASYEVLENIINDYELVEDDIETYKYVENKNHSIGMKIVYSDDTKSLQNLKEIIEKIMCDKKIELPELLKLKEWLNNNEQLIGNYPFDKISGIVNNVLEDGVVSKEEYDILIHTFNDFINPVSEEKTNCNIVFENKIFCLTGTFNSGSKDQIEDKIMSKGGTCGKGVTSKTNYLIVGGSGSEAWKFGNYGGKVQKAMELKEKGKEIEIIGEDDFLNYI